MITSTDQRALEEISNTLFSLQRSKIGAEEAIVKIRAKYKEMLTDDKSSPIALAIASMAASDASATVPADQEKEAAKSTSLTTKHGGHLGMVAGAVIGGAGCAIIGAVFGGIAGRIAGACAD